MNSIPEASSAAITFVRLSITPRTTPLDALRLRLGKFGLTLEPTKTKLVEFGRFAQKHAGKRGRNRPETIYFLGLTLYCTRNQKGNFKVGMRTEKSRLRRSLTSLQELMQRIRHHTNSEQVGEINAGSTVGIAESGRPRRPVTNAPSIGGIRTSRAPGALPCRGYPPE